MVAAGGGAGGRGRGMVVAREGDLPRPPSSGKRRHAHGGVAWRERILGATSALPRDGRGAKDPREQLESEKRGGGWGGVVGQWSGPGRGDPHPRGRDR